ncbi:unnamed protein product, partial [Polarella glacialis]
LSLHIGPQGLVLASGSSSKFPVPAEQDVLNGVETFISWPESASSGGRPPAALLLFHGCSNSGADWFRKPEEIQFLRAAQRRGLALLAFTTPVHLGNFCWPSPGGEKGDEGFEAAASGVRGALAEVLKARLPTEGGSALPLLLVGGSSGGSFASRLPEHWQRAEANETLGVGKVSGLLVVISPTAFVRRGELEGRPPPDYPPTGLVFMPRDTSFASEGSVALAATALLAAGVPTKAWPVGPRPLSSESLAAQLRSAGVDVKDEGASKFLEALVELGLVHESGQVLSDPRRFPWHRVSWKLTEGLVGQRPDRSADPNREHRVRCVEELLNRAWAQHEFAAGDIADEVLDWALAQAKVGLSGGPEGVNDAALPRHDDL